LYKKVFVPELGYRPESWYSGKYLQIFDTVAESALKRNRKIDAF